MEATGRYVKEIGCVSGWDMGWQRLNYCVLGGCLLSLSLCRKGFQNLLKVRSSSLLTLCGCIWSSTASLMSRSTYMVLAERSFVSCSLIMWSWLMLCSATAGLLGHASLIWITQKKAYNTQDMAEVWNQEHFIEFCHCKSLKVYRIVRLGTCC